MLGIEETVVAEAILGLRVSFRRRSSSNVCMPKASTAKDVNAALGPG